ncbi:MAG: carbohydrate-binding domain-containing protein [Bacteroidales bacterium]|nr:carbohydrate-binding domain-containing protein [Bacteroidales bacterium]
MSHPSFSQFSHRTIRSLLSLTIVLGSLQVNAQEKMFLHLTSHSTLGAPIGSTDSIWFSSDSTTAFFQIGDTLVQHLLTEIDSITFGAPSDTVFIDYNGGWFSVINPYAFEGLDVAVSGADAIVTSANDTLDVVYCLSGSSSDGMFKLYSETPYTLVLNGVNLTNSDGPTINIQAKKSGEIVQIGGTSNTLTDGAVYADPPSGEDQKGAFFSEGALQFSGSGALTLTASGDGIDGDEGEVMISGGTVEIEVPGDACKGIKTDLAINLNGGTVNILNSGDAVLEASGAGYDPSYCTAVKSDDDIVVNGATVTIESTGMAGKGFSADDGIKSEYLIETDNATLSITSSVEGLEAPFININSGTVEIKSSDDCINTTFGLGGELDDGSLLQITGGLISLNTTGGDGIDSNGDILFTGGVYSGGTFKKSFTINSKITQVTF